jgi:hypothetical protein
VELPPAYTPGGPKATNAARATDKDGADIDNIEQETLPGKRI